jgi:hypothetical protein
MGRAVAAYSQTVDQTTALRLALGQRGGYFTKRVAQFWAENLNLENDGTKDAYHINIFYSEQDGGYIADIPDLASCSAFGATAADALREVEMQNRRWAVGACVTHGVCGLLNGRPENWASIPRLSDRRFGANTILGSQCGPVFIRGGDDVRHLFGVQRFAADGGEHAAVEELDVHPSG